MLRQRVLECSILMIPYTCMNDNYKAISKLSELTLFLCNANQKNANQTLIKFGFDELLCLDKELLSVQF